MSRRIRLFAATLLWGVLLVVGGPLAAQTLPSAEQLEILRSLTPEQREQILRQLGEGATIGTQRRDSVDPRYQRPEETRAERERRLRLERLAREAEEESERLRRRTLRPEDTILIQIDFERRQTATTGAASVQLPTGAAPTTPTAPLTPAVPLTPEERRELERERERNPPLTAEERARLEELIDLVRSRNPYKLDRNGVLYLPGFGSAGIELAGLTEELATLRLQAEPAFRRLEVQVILLPLEKTGVEGLRPFGYDLFEEEISTFAPVTEVPVPADYVVGPGDELDIQLYGNQNRSFTLVVGRDGRINFPELGPISVGGRRFDEVRSDIQARVESQMIGVRASVAMGETRAIQVFVLGEARYPGTYTVSGLATITTALYAAGGIKPIGSLRRIQLKRQGQTVRELDLYDLLIHGNTKDDAKLLPGDAIFIPPVGATVSVDGEVRRPAIYEIKDENTVADLVALAGGLTPEADRNRMSLVRIDEQGRRIVLPVSLDQGPVQSLRTGDLLRVARLRPQLDSGVILQGHVYRTGPFAYREGMRLTDVIGSIDELRPNADLHYVLIRRELPPDRRVTVLSADLGEALRNPGSEADVRLMPRDQITVFDLQSGRERVIQPIMDELRLQSNIDRPTEVVEVSGQVKVPGKYPLEPGMTVRDLIRAGGGLEPGAYGGTAELARYVVVNGESRRTELIEIDLAAALRGDPAANVELRPYDILSIKEVPNWESQEKVTLRGEVRFPGVYPIRPGETLQSVIERAGGLTEFAFPQGAVFTRRDLKQREQQQLDLLTERLQGDLAVLALQGIAANQAQAATALQVGQQLLAQLRSTEAVGRLVIDLERTLKARRGSPDDIILRDGDELLVPKLRQEVTVIGEVQNEASHLYRPELERDDYISLSGGTTRRADRGKIYVVRANGSVVAADSNRWYRRDSTVEIRPGDTIVVPLDTERLPALPFWQAVTQIIYNLAIAAAAVNSF